MNNCVIGTSEGVENKQLFSLGNSTPNRHQGLMIENIIALLAKTTTQVAWNKIEQRTECTTHVSQHKHQAKVISENEADINIVQVSQIIRGFIYLINSKENIIAATCAYEFRLEQNYSLYNEVPIQVY
jgi:hypothetical protein